MGYTELMAEFQKTELAFDRDAERTMNRLMAIRAQLDSMISRIAGTVNKKEIQNEN